MLEKRTFGDQTIVAVGARDSVQGVVADIVPGAVSSSGSLRSGGAEDGGDGTESRDEDGGELHY